MCEEKFLVKGNIFWLTWHFHGRKQHTFSLHLTFYFSWKPYYYNSRTENSLRFCVICKYYKLTCLKQATGVSLPLYSTTQFWSHAMFQRTRPAFRALDLHRWKIFRSFAIGSVKRKTIGNTRLYNKSLFESSPGRKIWTNVNSLNKISQLGRCILTFPYPFFCFPCSISSSVSFIYFPVFAISFSFLFLSLFCLSSCLFHDLVLLVSLIALLYSYPPNSFTIFL